MRGQMVRHAGLLVLLALAGCSMQKKEALRIESPDHSTVATLMEEIGGGATVSTVYQLYLSSQSDGDRKLVFDATYCGGISLAWRGSNTLVLQYNPGCDIDAFHNTWWSSKDIQNPSLPPVEIILLRRPGADQ